MNKQYLTKSTERVVINILYHNFIIKNIFSRKKKADEIEEINKNVMCLRKQKLGGLIVNPHQFYIEVVVRTADSENQGDSGEKQ